ncbi:unnamed protein product [Cochlearia groenlandica]
MKISYHSPHQPRCGVCFKHCKSFESVREHLHDNLFKGNCVKVFSQRGCSLCLRVFEEASELSEHKIKCLMSPPPPLVSLSSHDIAIKRNVYNPSRLRSGRRVKVVAMDCEMVGGGENGSEDLCASVCVVDENENVIFSTYVQPEEPVTDYRHDVTGLTEEDLKKGMTLEHVRARILSILCDGYNDGVMRLLLVGHDLKHDMNCLNLKYPSHLLRDTAMYTPLQKTNLVSQSLKYLTKSYLGYKVQCEKHDAYEDSMSAMRLYKRMRDQEHGLCGKEAEEGEGLNAWKQSDLEKMKPEELYLNSASDYRCWCLDRLINP